MSIDTPEALTELFIAELNERLFVHFTQGRWCAPLSDRLLPVGAFDGDRVVQIACADASDIDRAVAGWRASGLPLGDPYEQFDAVRGSLRALRRLEGIEDPVQPAVPVALPGGTSPLVLLSAAATPVSVIAGVLIAGRSRGVVWKPAPRAAASAHLLMRALGPGASGRLALVQGDHRSGAMLAGQGALIWASDAAPPAGLEPVLSLAATVPRRR